jgi:hypothetical protein
MSSPAIARRPIVERDHGMPQKPTGAVAPRPKSLLSEIEIDFGPRDLFGRFFLAADTAARARGVELSFAPLETLLEVNRANPATWRPLLPIFDHTAGGIAADNGFAIVGRNRSGEIVATQAARLYKWTDCSFRDAAEDLTLFYPDPERQKRPGERCPVTAPAARNLTGRCVFSGAVWFHPDYRGRWLTGILPRLSRALAHTRWYCDYTLTIMAEGVVRGGTAERVGYRHVDWDLTLINSPVGDHIRCAVCWMPTADMLADLATFADLADAQVDAVVLDRAG